MRLDRRTAAIGGLSLLGAAAAGAARAGIGEGIVGPVEGLGLECIREVSGGILESLAIDRRDLSRARELIAVNVVREGWVLLRHAVGGLMDQVDARRMVLDTGRLEIHD